MKPHALSITHTGRGNKEEMKTSFNSSNGNFVFQPASLRSPTLAGAPIILSPSRGAAGGQTAANAAAAAALAAQLQAVANQQQQNAAAAAFTQQAAAAAAAAPAAVAAGIPAHLLQPQTLTQGDYGQLYIKYVLLLLLNGKVIDDCTFLFGLMYLRLLCGPL